MPRGNTHARTTLLALAIAVAPIAVFGSGSGESAGNAAPAVISVPEANAGDWPFQQNLHLLISVEELASIGSRPETLVLDARGLDDYLDGHVPGSVVLPRADLEDEYVVDGVEYSDLKSPEDVTAPLRDAGIRNDSRIVIVGDSSSSGPRLFWVLDYLGHQNVSLLNGGFAAWKAAGQPVSIEAPDVARGDFVPKPIPTRIADYAYVKASLSNDAIITCNALSETSFRKEAIPGSVSLPQSTLKVVGDIPFFRAADELKSLLTSIGYTPEKELVFYCGGGGAASVDYLAARILGIPKVRNYDGSLSEWKARGDVLTPAGAAG